MFKGKGGGAKGVLNNVKKTAQLANDGFPYNEQQFSSQSESIKWQFAYCLKFVFSSLHFSAVSVFTWVINTLEPPNSPTLSQETQIVP